MSKFQRLKKTGFKLAGSWRLGGGCIIPDIHTFVNEKPVLYALIVNEKIKYIGKTSRLLRQRMMMYRKPGKTQKTNIRINKEIKKVLGGGGDVLIYALINNGKEYKGFKLSLPAALEDSMIKMLDPDWNIRK